jgi:Mrp family chromosome partitioning ATPase
MGQMPAPAMGGEHPERRVEVEKKGVVKRVFPGNNTSLGFYSFYDYILPADATRILIIKGGPGVGKSTFMKKIAAAMVDRGYDIEYHHCASDNASLDGITFPQIGVAIVDGTAPHVVDPKHPGAVDEIIHLGDYWNENGVRNFRKEIMAVSRAMGHLFTRAYRFLKAAQAVYDDWEAANAEAMDFGRANRMADDLMRELFGTSRVALRVGRDRHLFASAITPDGHINYLYTILGPCRKKYVIEGAPGTGKSVLLGKVARAAMERGYDVELYHCPLNPLKVEHVLIPGLSVALTKSIEPHTYTPGPGDTVIDMNQCLNPVITGQYREVIAGNTELFERLFSRAIGFIEQAKGSHDLLESYYVPNMDFAGIENLRLKTLDRILRYAREAEVKVGGC